MELNVFGLFEGRSFPVANAPESPINASTMNEILSLPPFSPLSAGFYENFQNAAPTPTSSSKRLSILAELCADPGAAVTSLDAQPIDPATLVQPFEQSFEQFVQPLAPPLAPHVSGATPPIKPTNATEFVEEHIQQSRVFRLVDAGNVSVFTTAATVSTRPNLFTYTLPKSEMQRLLAAQFAMPGVFMAAASHRVARCDWSDEWRSLMATFVEDKVVMMPCDVPSETNLDWMRDNVVGHYVMMCTYDDDDTSRASTICVGIGVVTDLPYLNTLDPATRMRGGRTDDFPAFTDANRLLLPVHCIVCPLVTQRTLNQHASTIAGKDMYVDLAVPAITHSALPAPLELHVVDVHAYTIGDQDENACRGQEVVLLSVASAILHEASKRLDVVEAHKQELAHKAWVALMSVGADTVLSRGANKAWRKKIKSMVTFLKLYASNVQHMHLYHDYNELASMSQ